MGRAARTPDKFVVCLATHVQRLVRLKLPIIGDSNDGSFSHRRLLGQTTAVSQPFFEARTIDLSRRLLGCVLTHRGTAGMIVETEAYLGEDDLAAHSSRGETQRTKVIFGPPGRAYVYFIYGMHECLNIVAEPAGKPGCVLIRALQPLTDIELMRQRRQWKGNITGLTNGPGKLTQALDITRAQYGARLDRGGLTIRHWRKQPQFAIETTPRIGIRECADWPLRFVWAGHPCLSRN
ncbi:MAG TPA: DNA-3-methyladenine glycosylase [Bryobacteraceae bacterium]|nr:DNA-3-methyladenine glycosylase [Bryobacteraceae bacterium]